MRQISYKANQKPVKNRQALIQDLEDQICPHQGEIDCLRKAIEALSGGQNMFFSEKPIAKQAASPYGPYPITGDILSKITFLEDKHHKFWSMSDMKELIIEAEPDSYEETLSSFATKIYKLIKDNRVIKMAYNNSKHYSFYCTSGRTGWFEKISEDPEQYQILKAHEPLPGNLERLTEEQMDPAKIVWSFISK